MRQVYHNLCTYSADLFGINSALYELGGLIVMHDASGCNSTYNTHDEPRWYTMDSMVYVSGLNEKDAILG
ncbi:MAG: oxidoreductase, partial [Eubacterium sp.]|nr:oxidoreductase [Eubacterium sp.]